MKSLVLIFTVAIFVALLTACTGTEPSPTSAPPADASSATARPPTTVAPSPTPLAEATTAPAQRVQPTAGASPAAKPTPPPTLVAGPAPTPKPATPGAAPEPTPVPGPQLSGLVDLQGLNVLYSRHGLSLDAVLQQVSAHSLDSAEVASVKTMGPDGAFAFNLPKDSAYLLTSGSPCPARSRPNCPGIDADGLRKVWN